MSRYPCKGCNGMRSTLCADCEAAAREAEEDARNVTGDPERYQLWRLCQCIECMGTGKGPDPVHRCVACRGEGRTRDLIATCATPEAVGVALVTLGREGEWDECPVGLLDTMGETGEKWIFKPWGPSPRNISDAGRVLRRARG